METPFLVAMRDGAPRVVRFLPSSPPLVPLLRMDGEISPDVDRVLTMVAREAQGGDVAARNALYTACEPKIARFVRRYRCLGGHTGCSAVFDLEDVGQEAFLVFADLLERWPGGDSFCSYFLGHYPWQLRNRVRRLTTGNRTYSGSGDSAGIHLLADGSAAASEAVVLVRAVAGRLPQPDGAILLWRVLDGDSFRAIAFRLGTSRRTVMRAWDRITEELRRSMKQ